MFNLNRIKELLTNSGIPENMINRGIIGLKSFVKPMEKLLEQKKPPENGWNDDQINFFLEILAHMDTNNDKDSFQIGEREARISTPLLYDISKGFIHGIGRSGDIKAPQPKAPGASFINLLTDTMVSFFMKDVGFKNIKGSIVLPLSTGMSIFLSLKSLIKQNSQVKNEDKLPNQIHEIIIPRIDHKSPLKAVELTDFIPKIIDSKLGHELREELTIRVKEKQNNKIEKSNMKNEKKQLEFIEKFGSDAVYVTANSIEENITNNTKAILSTTTFFPPRAPDNIKKIAVIAKNHNLVHIINNAYGVQSPKIMQLINSAVDAGRVDAIIQSTDKNFLTPVGGSIISSPNLKNLDSISKSYAGRGNSSPIVQLFVSMLSMGLNGYRNLVKAQQELRKVLDVEMKKIASELGEKILDVNNPVACMMSLSTFSKTQIEKLGGYLYNLRVTGPRVINPNAINFGASINNYPYPYIVMNAAIGARHEDISGAVNQLKKALSQLK